LKSLIVISKGLFVHVSIIP